jgi:ribosome-associated translation inhibitor RaiA
MSDPLDEVIETGAGKVEEVIDQATETLVSLKPSKLTIILVCVGGIAAGICVGWYLAGGMKIEEEFYAGVDEVAEEVEEQIGKHAADDSTGLEE